ncbi:MAG: DNA polymerase Y family protein, partial [Sandarakinorhabdus sp.]|nr:DNA polymerase Y family protein [Sandarakinorhabdus sp.]
LPGLPLADARAQEPRLAVVAHDPVADAALLRALARLCEDATPTVAIERPDALLLEIGGSSHLFGGPQALADRLRQRMEAHGMHLREALGATPDAALAFARYPSADGMIGHLPVAALSLGEDAERGLRRAGLALVRDVARQPRAAIAARFGMGAALALDRLDGSAPRPLSPRREHAPLRFEERLAEPVATADGVRAIMARLIERACRRLARRGLGGRRFDMSLFRTDGQTHGLAMESGRPTRDPAAIARLFAERIEALADPLDPGFGYDRILLSIGRTDALAAHQPALEAAGDRVDDRDGDRVGDRDGDRRNDALAALIDRLSIRFGPARLLRLLPAQSHVPERAERRVEAQSAERRSADALSWPQPLNADPPARPIFLFDPPEPVEVLAEVPDGPPFRFRWRSIQHRVACAEGPERIAPEWWRLKDGALHGGRTRDYWRVEDMEGRRFWLFRHGLCDEPQGAPRAGGMRPPGWFLHGLFA